MNLGSAPPQDSMQPHFAVAAMHALASVVQVAGGAEHSGSVALDQTTAAALDQTSSLASVVATTAGAGGEHAVVAPKQSPPPVRVPKVEFAASPSSSSPELSLSEEDFMFDQEDAPLTEEMLKTGLLRKEGSGDWSIWALSLGAKARNSLSKAHKLCVAETDDLKKQSRKLKQSVAQQKYLKKKREARLALKRERTAGTRTDGGNL